MDWMCLVDGNIFKVFESDDQGIVEAVVYDRSRVCLSRNAVIKCFDDVDLAQFLKKSNKILDTPAK